VNHGRLAAPARDETKAAALTHRWLVLPRCAYRRR
jgi:hypothetical protein